MTIRSAVTAIQLVFKSLFFIFSAIVVYANAASANMVLTPLGFEMDRNTRVTTVSVTNDNTKGETVLYQARALLWNGLYDEQFKTKKQKNIIVTPAIFKLAPGQTRVLRIHSVNPRALATPSSYRIVVSSMPPIKSDNSLLAVRKNISLPLIVEGGFRPR